VDKFSTVSHSIISGLTMPSCSPQMWPIATKIVHFSYGVPVIMNHRVCVCVCVGVFVSLCTKARADVGSIFPSQFHTLVYPRRRQYRRALLPVHDCHANLPTGNLIFTK